MLSWKTDSGRNRAMIQELPDELLLEIAFLLQDKIGNHTDDLLALCKVSKALARTAQEVLFQDCYIAWPRAQVLNWVLDFKQKLMTAELLSQHISDTQFIQWFDWTGVQRHLKNLGI